LKRAVVRKSAVTPSSAIAAASRSGARVTSRGRPTTAAPFRSAPQISKVAASNEMLAACPTRSPGPRSANPPARARRATARCGTATPFGRPVEPEVKRT
jgi:hypothetical protein